MGQVRSDQVCSHCPDETENSLNPSSPARYKDMYMGRTPAGIGKDMYMGQTMFKVVGKTNLFTK